MCALVPALELDSSDFALMFDYANFLDEVISVFRVSLRRECASVSLCTWC
jgi:hypothetical protein